MKFNWKFFCYGGLASSALFGGFDYYGGNIAGAKLQLILGLAYAMGLTYLLLKDKND